MNLNRYKYISGVVAACGVLFTAVSCRDELFIDQTPDDMTLSSDYVLYEAYISRINANTRSTDDQEELSPLVVMGGDKQLYLHTYVCDNSFDPARMETEPETRGAQVNSTTDFLNVHEKFGVEARLKQDMSSYLQESSSYMLDHSLEGMDYAVWGAEGKTVYWPGNDAMLSVHAWAPRILPQELTSLSKAAGKVSFSYETQKSSSGNTDAEAQTDLLWAVADCKKSISNEGRVQLHFTHPLSAIKFAVRDVVGGTVKSISLKHVYSKGDCLYLLKEMNGTYDYTDSSNGEYTWSNQSAPASFKQVFDVHVDDSYGKEFPKDDVSVTAQKPEATFMMIPQIISDDAEIEIEFERDNMSASEATVILRGKIKDNAVTQWLPGKEYVYTISTNSANWTYVFEVNGSYRNGTEVYMPSPADTEIYNTFEEGGGRNYPYYEVVSYRYRSNKPSVKENLPWEASHGNGVQYYYNTIYPDFATKDAILYSNRDKSPSERDEVPANTWITDTKGLSGVGGVSKDRHKISFYRAHVTTDWEGDTEMYKKIPYEGNSESNPWNLGTFGGQRSLNTANCYVVDREGWYAIPLYYGNAMVEGAPNPTAWKSDLTNLETYTDTKNIQNHYYALQYFKDHKGSSIEATSGGTGKIPSSYYKSAHLLWQDTYDIVDEVKLTKVGGEDMIVFHVNRSNIQQGNVVLGISEHDSSSWNVSDPKIVWSWHIWVNEHWLNNNGMSNAFENSGFDASINDRSQMREQGDVAVSVPRNSSNTRNFSVAPYNIGWCDAKNVRYLSRYNKMEFVQYRHDNTPTGATAELPLIQDGRTIEYKYGNNVYFQFGRKDPFVGFKDHDKETLKEHYGELPYTIQPQFRTISYSIQNPHALFVGASQHNATDGFIYAEWNKESNWQTGTNNSIRSEYYNLWNNNSYDKRSAFSANLSTTEFFRYTKTVYDPSPAGYAIPPVGFFKILFKSDPTSYNINASNETNLSKLNGKQQDAEGFLYRIYTSRTSTSEFFSLTSTGHRWYATTVQNPGTNFNPHLVYLWTNSVTKTEVAQMPTNDRSAYSIALGFDNGKYIISAAFNGRKSMARPIRCIRESVSVRQ